MCILKDKDKKKKKAHVYKQYETQSNTIKIIQNLQTAFTSTFSSDSQEKPVCIVILDSGFAAEKIKTWRV